MVVGDLQQNRFRRTLTQSRRACVMYERESGKQGSGYGPHSANMPINRCYGQNRRTLHGTTDRFKTEKGVWQVYAVTCLFTYMLGTS